MNIWMAIQFVILIIFPTVRGNYYSLNPNGCQEPDNVIILQTKIKHWGRTKEKQFQGEQVSLSFLMKRRSRNDSRQM